MANGNSCALTGNLVREVEYRVAASGAGFARGSIAVNRSRKQGDEWVEETSFIDFSILDDQMAQNACELPKGARVTVTGWWQQRTVETDEGNRSFHSLVVDDIAASLRWATVSVHRNEKKTGGQQAAVAGLAEKLGGKVQRGDFFDEPF